MSEIIFLSLKSLHLIAVLTWVAGLFILGRLFVYHSEAFDSAGHNIDGAVTAFNDRISRTAKYILTPSFILMLIPGLIMSYMISTGFGTREAIQIPTWIVWVLILNVPHILYYGLGMYLTARLNDQSSYLTAKQHRILSEVLISPFIVIIVVVIVFR